VSDAARRTGPVGRRERIDLLDALRGLAILGILLGNVAVFSGLLLADLAGGAAGFAHGPVDRVTEFLVHLLVEGKFYGTFSLLFGVGFGLQLARSDALGRPFASFFRRRMGFLLLFGVVHALLWAGDILWLYALVGLALIPFGRCRERTLLVWIVALLAAPVVLYGLLALLVAASGAAPGGGDSGLQEMFAATLVAFDSGGPRDVFDANLRFLLFGRLPQLVVTGRPFNVLAMFLVGFCLARRRARDGSPEHRVFLRRLFLIGAGVGPLANLVLAALMHAGVYFDFRAAGFLQSVAYQVGVPSLCLFYVAGFALLFQSAPWRRRLMLLAPVGRSALSNYILQSVVCILVFYGIGLGAMGELGATAATALVFVIYPLQIVVSRWWLARFRFGPLEWVWRSATYGRAQPLRGPAR
jgi:uncharacterized protein